MLWSLWLTSPYRKTIGIMYGSLALALALVLVMLIRALIEAAPMRAQQAFGLSCGLLSPEHFAQLFSTNGTIMIFFVVMAFLGARMAAR